MIFDEFDFWFVKLKEKKMSEAKFLDMLDEYFGGCDKYLQDTSSLYIAVKILADAVEDEFGWLEYYFFEQDCHSFDYEADGEKLTCSGSSEDLWKLIQKV